MNLKNIKNTKLKKLSSTMKHVFSAPKLNNKHIKASSPPKFGIRPNNSKVMFMKSELDTKEILNEKIKQAQLKEILE